MKKTNICIIGGGSRLWAISFMKDLVVNKMTNGRLVLYDINKKAARNNEEVARRMFALNNESNRFTIDAVDDIGEALTGADLVIISIEPGSIVCRKGDLLLPEEYGILQTVGDTTGPGGIMRARRTLPTFFEFAKQIKKYCPNAWVINYTNPMTLCTAALYRAFPEIKCFGCCHEVFHIEDYICSLVAKWFSVPAPGRRELNVDITGINHFTFITKASWNGIDLMPRIRELASDPAVYEDKTALALERTKEEKWFDCDHLVPLELLRTFGALGAAGDRHLCEFVPWMLADEKQLNRYGVMRTPYSWRESEDKKKKKKIFTDADLAASPSGEEGVDIMRALFGDMTLLTNMNLPNNGQVSYLPRGHIVETNAYLSENSIRPLMASDPPLAVQNLIQRVAVEQDIALNAIESGDDELLFQAFASDALMNIPLNKARELFEKMKTACALKYDE